MKIRIALLSLLAAASLAHGEEFLVYKASVKWPVLRITPDSKIETQTLVTNDVINIALGKALGTPIPSGTILAVIGNENDMAPAGKLVVFSTSDNTVGPVVATMSTINFNFQDAGRGAKGIGASTSDFADVGTPGVAQFYSNSVLHVGGSAGGGPANPFTFQPSGAGSTTTVTGHLKFTFTPKGTNVPVDYEGIVVKGTISGGGKPAVIDQ